MNKKFGLSQAAMIVTLGIILVLISVFAIKLQHWARIDKPLKPIMKLHKLALTASERQETLVMLLQPIVISNKPLIKAEQISFVSPKEENKKHNM